MRFSGALILVGLIFFQGRVYCASRLAFFGGNAKMFLMKNKIFALLFALIFVAGGFGLATWISQNSAKTAASIEDSEIRIIYVDDAMRAAGLRVDRVLLAKKSNKATIYVSFLQPFSEAVILQAHDRTGIEIGRSRRLISGKTDEAMYVDFDYNANVPLKLAESFKLVYAKALPPAVEETETPTASEEAAPPPPADSGPALNETPEAAPQNDVPAETQPEETTEAAPL